MPAADPAGVKRELAAGKLRAAYLLYGDESLLKSEAAEAIRRAVLGDDAAASAWNLTVLEGESAGMGEILDAARTLPMLGERRLVWIRDAERLAEADPEGLREYLKAPNPSSCLLFVAGAGRPDFRRGVFRVLQQLGAPVEFAVPKGAGWARAVRERVRHHQAEIDDEAIGRLQEYLAAELEALKDRNRGKPVPGWSLTQRLDQELAKALDYLAPGRRITAGALDETLAESAGGGSSFALADAAAAGDVAEAIRLLRAILRASGEDEAVRLLVLITRQVRILILGQALMKAGRKGTDLAEALGLPPYGFIIEKTEKMIRGFPESAGAPSLRRLLEADRALKGGAGKGAAVLERLVLDLAALTSPPAARREARK